jgi:hypothetical protein
LFRRLYALMYTDGNNNVKNKTVKY